jgi:hypothetical protein
MKGNREAVDGGDELRYEALPSTRLLFHAR